MAFTDVFVRRPVLASCLNLLILLAGLYSVGALTVRQYPRSDLAVVTVQTAYVGADSDLVRGFVSTPLERAIASADGIDYLESKSARGVSTITAHLRLNFDVNDALTQIQSKISQVRNELPPEAEAPVVKVETSDNRFASMYLSFYSDDLEANQITDYLVRVVQPQLAAVPGVQRADILGARVFAMRIWLRPDRMAALHITPAMLRAALQKNNSISAIGQVKGNMVSVGLVANTDLRSKEEFENLVILNDGATLVRLRDIADVVLGAENYDEDVRFSGEAATFMGVWVLPNANALDVIAQVRSMIPDLAAAVPSGMKVGIPYDATAYIRDAIHEVLKTLTETVLIVIAVIYLFIGSFRAVLVPIMAIPLSLIGATAMMFFFGFTINLLTLLAIVLAVGLVVDDAIVMLENVERHVSEGMRPFDAALRAGRELAAPTIAMTITLAAVYAPIAIQGGLTGALFKEFALTLAGAVVISGFVALTLSPMMSSKLLHAGERPSSMRVWLDGIFGRFEAWYQKKLTRALEVRYGVLAGSALFVLLIPLLYMFSTKELAPREDQGVVFAIVQAAPNSSLEQTLRYTNEMQRQFASFPEYRQTFQLISPTFGFSGMLLTPWSERSRSAFDIEGEAWGKMGMIPGVRAIVTTPPPLPGGSDFQVEMVISSTDEPLQMMQYAGQIVGAAFQSGSYMFADSDLKVDLPEDQIVLDREKIAAMGLSLEQVGADLSTYLGGNYVNRFSIQGRSYKVIPQVKRSARLTSEQLQDLYVTGPNQSMVPLSTFAALRSEVRPRELNRFQQLNSAKIQGALVPGVSLDAGLRVIEDAAKRILPRGYLIDYAGEARQLRREASSMNSILLVAAIVIFLVLAAQFESFRDPFIILAGSVPLALAGALLFAFLGFTTLNIYSQVGLITLVGLVAKNGILIVEFANRLQREGLDRFAAVRRSAEVRLRPVLMTSIATVVGHFPLVLASGPGAGARNSIGIVLVSGMIIGTLFTLFVVPVVYTFISAGRTPQELPVPTHGQSESGSVEAVS